MERFAVLERIASIIGEIDRPHPLRIGIDGIDGAGKTVLGDELAAPIERLGRSVIRASVDGFHHPRAVRYQRGRDSPVGYFHDSFDYAALIRELLEPLGPDGSRHYRTAVFDHRTDLPALSPRLQAAPRSIGIVDGVFLHRPELRPYWDLTIFVDASFEVATRRCADRDHGSPDPAAAENRRYSEGQRMYLAECDPRAIADLVIDNNDLTAPRLVLFR